MSYLDALKQLQENLHIERQLETFPQWVTMMFIIAIGFIIVPFAYQTLCRSISVYEIETNNPTFHSIMDSALILGVIGTCIIGTITLGYALISGDAIIESTDDYIVLRNNWSSGRYFTYTRSNQMYKVGCFLGTGDELIEKAYKDSQLSGDCYKASVQYVQMLEQAFTHNKQKQ